MASDAVQTQVMARSQMHGLHQPVTASTPFVGPTQAIG